MAQFKLEHNRPECIGCGACAAIAPDFWTMDDNDGKSDIRDCAKRDDGWEERKIEDSQFTLNKEAAETCPVNVIHLKNLDTGEEII